MEDKLDFRNSRAYSDNYIIRRRSTRKIHK